MWPFVGVVVRWCLFSLSLSRFFSFFSKKKIQTFGLQKFGTKMIWTFGIKMKNEKKSEKKKEKREKTRDRRSKKRLKKNQSSSSKKKTKRLCSLGFALLRFDD